MREQMHVGRLDRQITIQQRAVTRNATYGSEVVAWATLATVWAQVVESSTPPGGNAGEDQRVAAYERPIKVRVRWRNDVDTTMRISYAGRLLQITGTAELNRRQWLEMACQEWAHE